MNKRSTQTAGTLFAASSYLFWAFFTPLYFKFLISVPLVELLIWRILSGLPLLIGLLLFRRTFLSCIKSLKDRRTVFALLASTFFISINWVVFVVAIVTERLTEASLGYYINPLVTVALGFVFLGERIRPLQCVAVGIAMIAVVYLTIEQGSLPWISMCLAGSFAMYGLLRKTMAVGSIEGLTVEMGLMYPLCIALQIWVFSTSRSTFSEANIYMIVGLLLGGLVTIIPLLLFASGARRLQLSTMGILQYIAPTGQLLLAILLFGEPFGMTQVIVFSMIWLAIALYSFDALRSSVGRTNDNQCVQ